MVSSSAVLLKMGVQWVGRAQTTGAKFYERLSVLEEHKTSTLKCKSKGKVHPRTGHEGPEGKERYSSGTKGHKV
jgi:hypothetical protein